MECIHAYTVVEPVYYGHIGTNQKCPAADYQDVPIFQVIFIWKSAIWDLISVDYAGVLNFKCQN